MKNISCLFFLLLLTCFNLVYAQENKINEADITNRVWSMEKPEYPEKFKSTNKLKSNLFNGAVWVFMSDGKYEVYRIAFYRETALAMTYHGSGEWAVTSDGDKPYLELSSGKLFSNKTERFAIREANKKYLKLVDKQEINYEFSFDPTVQQDGDMAKISSLLATTTAEFQPELNLKEAQPAKIYIYCPRNLTGSGKRAYYAIRLNEKHIALLNYGERMVYEIYSEGILEVKAKLTEDPNLMESANTDSQYSNAYSSAGMNTEAEATGIKALFKLGKAAVRASTKKKEEIEIVRGKTYYVRVNPTSAAVTVIENEKEALEDFEKGKKYFNEPKIFKEDPHFPLPGMSLVEELEKQRQEFLKIK